MMNLTTSFFSRLRGVVLAGVALAVLGLGVVVPMVQPAAAEARVSVSGELDANSGGSLQLQGSGFQSVQNGFGGIYVLFGWVDGGSWRPSQGGVTGENYRYVYDDESKPEGYQLFVTFPGSSTAYAANGGEIAADGTWSGTLKVPGAIFNTFDRQNNEAQVNCLEVQCGVITIGAHGVKNANNESFTPVNFTGTAAANTAPQEQQNNQEAGTVPSAQATTNPTAAATAAPGATQAATGQVLVAGNQNNGWDIVAIVLIVIVALSILALACGIGGYLAAKSLLLGVNPAALEKVRGQRERKALAQREKEERKTADLERKHRIRAARQLQQEQAALGREALRTQPDAGNTVHPRQGATAAENGARNDSFDQVVQFFRRDDAADLPLDHRGAEPEAKTEVLTPDVRKDVEGGTR